jgi:hypothetical protein
MPSHVVSCLMAERFPELLKCASPVEAAALMVTIGEVRLLGFLEDMRQMPRPEQPVDHVRHLGCQATLCGRPSHLEDVTYKENRDRGQQGGFKGAESQIQREVRELADAMYAQLQALNAEETRKKEEAWARSAAASEPEPDTWYELS